MKTEATSQIDMMLYQDIDQHLISSEYMDPAHYSKDPALYAYALANDFFLQQQQLFQKSRVDAARFTNPNTFQMGIAVMEDHGQTNIDYEIEWFLQDDGIDPLQAQIDDAKRKAQEFMKQVKLHFPNRYFILKRVTDSNDFWQICALEKNHIVITDESYAKKLQNCYEVIISLHFGVIYRLAVHLLNRFPTTSSSSL